MSENKRSIIACIDGSTSSTAVSDYGIWMAKKMGINLTFLHTIETRGGPAITNLSGALSLGNQQELLDELADKEQQLARADLVRSHEIMSHAKLRAQEQGISLPGIVQTRRPLTEALIELEQQMRFLVVGIRGEAHEGNLKGVGTQLESLIRSMRRPILVVNKEFSEPKRTMLAYDGSPSCKKALESIARHETFADIPCHLVHVGRGADAMLAEAQAYLQEAGIKVQAVQIEGKLEEVLPAYQLKHDIDVTLMGAFSHTRLKGFLMGSFTAKMLANTSRPLFLLR